MTARPLRCIAWAAFGALGACGGGGGDDDAAAQPRGVLTGAVLYRERIALPANARIEVRLEDVTRADAPPDVLAEQTIESNGRQVPIPFELRYSPSRIEANHRYGVRASIRAPGGELLFTTATHRAVLEGGAAEQNVELLVQRVGGERVAATSLPGGAWRLVAIRRSGAAEESVAAEPRYTVAFADGRLTGLAHCNRFQGGYREPVPGKLEVSPLATTLMACPGPSIADEFLRGVGGATSYELSGQRLLLMYGDGGVLTFERDEQAAAAARPPEAAVAARPAQASRRSRPSS